MAIPAGWADRMTLPVVAAPMFLTSGPDLLIAASKAGVVGTLPALNQRSTEGFGQWLDQIRGELSDTDAPYGINLIVHKSNPRVAADLEVIRAHKVPLVITSLGAVAEVVDTVHSYGGVVFHDVTTARHAQKAAEAGVDGLILVSAGAGGHAGTINPFALLHEVRRHFDGTILLAGAITTGGDVAAAQMMGADLAYMGTRFIATNESMASPENKQMLVDSGADEILYTPAISSIGANFLTRSIVQAGLDPGALKAPERVDLSHVTDPYRKTQTESKAWRDIWSAGQGVAGINEVHPAADLVARLKEEYTEAVVSFAARSFS